MPKDINKDGTIDDGEVLDLLKEINDEYYWAEVAKKNNLINNVEKQNRSCEEKAKELSPNEKSDPL